MEIGSINALALAFVDWMQAQALPNMVFFQEINGFLDDEIGEFAGNLLGRVVTVAGSAALTLLTLWILVDASASMAVDPGSWQRVVEVAAVFGEAALNGSDQVRFGVAPRGRVNWGSVSSRDAQLRREIVKHAQAQDAEARHVRPTQSAALRERRRRPRLRSALQYRRESSPARPR